MSEAQPVTTTSEAEYHGPSRTWVGWVFFAATMMILAGFYQAIMGFVALFDEGYFAVTEGGLITNVEYATWGWIHLAFGLIAIVSGFGVMFGQAWARVVGVAMAMVSVLTNVAFLAAYPIWCISVIVIDVIAVYALIVHGGEVEDAVGLD
jgi:hypothetical protein